MEVERSIRFPRADELTVMLLLLGRVAAGQSMAGWTRQVPQNFPQGRQLFGRAYDAAREVLDPRFPLYRVEAFFRKEQ
jgi:hypothetical protein